MEAVKISRSSKLGRYYDYVCDVVRYDEIERWEDLNLCVFVRRLFGGTLIVALYGFFFILLFCGMVYSICGLVNIRLVPFNYDRSALQILLECSGIVGWFWFVFFVLKFVAKRIKARQEKHQGNHSLLFVWIKARKEKVCPIIEVED